MCLPTSVLCLPADFSHEQLDKLRLLLRNANHFEQYNQIVREVDAKAISKFANHGTDLDFRSERENVEAIFMGVFLFFKQRAPVHLVRDLALQLALVYAPKRADRYEDYAPLIHALHAAQPTGKEPEHASLPGVWDAYRWADLPGEAIVKSVVRIDAVTTAEGAYLSFKLVYRHAPPVAELAQLPCDGTGASRDVGRIHGLVLLKPSTMFFVGNDDQGDVPFQMTIDRPASRPAWLTGVFTRLSLDSMAIGSSILLVRRETKPIERRRIFRSMYGRIGIHPSETLIREDGLSDLLWALDNSVGPDHGRMVIRQNMRGAALPPPAPRSSRCGDSRSSPAA